MTGQQAKPLQEKLPKKKEKKKEHPQKKGMSSSQGRHRTTRKKNQEKGRSSFGDKGLWMLKTLEVLFCICC
ncbi:hypothetical protein JTE90_009035 [Oedothorax gibbosus]|uniref:Uncharacterized protein n=1 Tax=Oedothorax gibbosus TaxID=931172 RepID=A0AAV6VIE0_9ARAC|nr:hypothetical protein JTE90_009035 [Oedothorax gibbosus]